MRDRELIYEALLSEECSVYKDYTAVVKRNSGSLHPKKAAPKSG